MTNIQQDLVQQLETAATQLGFAKPAKIHLEHPSDQQFGDYSSNLAMILFADQKKSNPQNTAVPQFASPKVLAQALAEQVTKQLNGEQNVISKVSVAGPGFTNFTLSNEYFIKELLKIVQNDGKVISQSGKGKKVVVEYSSPNIAKPFTIGHLRTTVIGDVIASLLEVLGWTVFRDNHLGDWGTQFGKQIYAIKAWGNEQEIEEAERPVKKLVELYVKFHQEAEQHPELEDEARKWFKKLEEGDPEAKRLWQKCIDWSFKEFQHIYDKLSIKFTENKGRGYGESFFENKMGPVIKELEEKGVLKDSEGAKLVFFENDKYPPMMIVKKDGATLYATRDLATDKFRLEQYGSDILVINEVGGEQAEYFRQLYAIEEMLGWYKPGQRVHVKHGLYRFKDQKMSTRKGNVIWLEDVLEEATKRASVLAKGADSTDSGESKTAATAQAEKVGLGALKWNDLKRSTILDVTFDWDEILSMEGNSGPYMQYTYARCLSVLSKAKKTQTDNSLEEQFHLLGEQITVEPNPEEKAVLRQLYQFSETVEKAAADFAPHHLCTYLFELAQAFNGFYNQHQIINNADPAVVQWRLALTYATAVILRQGLNILGIDVIDRM